MDITAIEAKIAAVESCPALTALQTEVTNLINAGITAINAQIAKLVALLADSTPAGFVANMIASITDTKTELEAKLNELTTAMGALSAAFLARALALGC